MQHTCYETCQIFFCLYIFIQNGYTFKGNSWHRYICLTPHCRLLITKTRLSRYILKNFTTKNWKFSDKNSDILDRLWLLLVPPRRGGSNDYPQCMFMSRNKGNNVYPCKPQFYYIKVEFKEVKIIKAWFRDVLKERISPYGSPQYERFQILGRKLSVIKSCLPLPVVAIMKVFKY